jgi:hypothetical protein
MTRDATFIARSYAAVWLSSDGRHWTKTVPR